VYPIRWYLQSWCPYPCGLGGFCGCVSVPSDSLIVSYFSHVPLRSASARIEGGWVDASGLWVKVEVTSLTSPADGNHRHRHRLIPLNAPDFPSTGIRSLKSLQLTQTSVGLICASLRLLLRLSTSKLFAFCPYFPGGVQPAGPGLKEVGLPVWSLLICILKLHYKLSAVRS